MLAELMALINTLAAVIRDSLLTPKEKQLLNKKVQEATRIIQTATPEEIARYDSKIKRLLRAIEEEKLGPPPQGYEEGLDEYTKLEIAGHILDDIIFEHARRDLWKK
jgi:hypothetical protein